MKRRLSNIVLGSSLVLCALTIVASISNHWVCQSVGFKTSSGAGYRIYSCNNQLVFVNSRDLIMISHAPERQQGLFPRPQGSFSWGLESVPQSSAPDFHLGDHVHTAWSEFWVPFGFVSGGMHHSFEYGGPLGGFNIVPMSVVDFDSYAIPFWFVASVLAVVPAIWILKRLKIIAASRSGFPINRNLISPGPLPTIE